MAFMVVKSETVCVIPKIDLSCCISTDAEACISSRPASLNVDTLLAVIPLPAKIVILLLAFLPR